MVQGELPDNNDGVLCLRVHENLCIVLCALFVSLIQEHPSHPNIFHLLNLVLSVEQISRIAKAKVIVFVPVAVLDFRQVVIDNPILAIFHELELDFAPL